MNGSDDKIEVYCSSVSAKAFVQENRCIYLLHASELITVVLFSSYLNVYEPDIASLGQIWIPEWNFQLCRCEGWTLAGRVDVWGGGKEILSS